jgi:hypothetical protein
MKKSNFSVSFLAANIAAKTAFATSKSVVNDIELDDITDISELRQMAKESDDDDDIEQINARIKVLKAEQKSSFVAEPKQTKLKSGDVLGLSGSASDYKNVTMQDFMTAIIKVPNEATEVNLLGVSFTGWNGDSSNKNLMVSFESDKGLLTSNRLPMSLQTQMQKFLVGDLSNFIKGTSGLKPLKPQKLKLVPIVGTTKSDDFKGTFAVTQPVNFA